MKHVRAGEHGAFTRVAFEFQGVVPSSALIKTGKGNFIIIFLDTTTALSRQTLQKTTKGIQSVKFIQEASRLTANITLSFPHFKLITFSLPNPNRFVIDAYRMPSPLETSELGDALPAEPLTAKPATEKPLQIKPATKEPLQTKPETDKPLQLKPETEKLIQAKLGLEEISQAKPEVEKPLQTKPEAEKPLHTMPEAGKPLPVEPDKTVMTAPAQANQMIQTKQSSTDKNYTIEIYILALLNVLALIVIVLLSLNLLRRRPAIPKIDSERLREIFGSLLTADKSLAAIDAMIKQELKKLQQS
ncbi:MAG: hypothetical protein JSV38_15210 [Desulfobacterales bacterium]|nr:MAG: hypothetical protein JSV38_15210 [Desulfobacterales bacterium]